MFGGFGMIDIQKLDDSLKLKALGRLLDTSHPMLIKIRSLVDLRTYFKPMLQAKGIDGLLDRGVELLAHDRLQAVDKEDLLGLTKYIVILRSIKINSIITEIGKNSLAYFNLRRQAKDEVGKLSPAELERLIRFIPPTLHKALRKAVTINLRDIEYGPYNYYPCKASLKELKNLTTKEIRLERSEDEPYCIFKFGLILTPAECITWCNKVRKLSSVRHKTTILKIAHGDVYSNERKYRFGLTDSPNCARCQQVETVEHKMKDCFYVKKIWDATKHWVDKLRIQSAPIDPIDLTLGAFQDSNLTSMTIIAEVLLRILRIRDSDKFLRNPKALVSEIIKYLIKTEQNDTIKANLMQMTAD